MKRYSTILLVVVFAFGLLGIPSDAKTKGKKKKVEQPTCAANIGVCAPEGCSSDNHHDPKLNILKNIPSNDQSVTDRSMEWMKTHPDPKHYTRGGKRDELTNLDEGKQVRVVGYLLRAKLELSGESCNCYLRTEAETDNHLVLVTKDTVRKFPIPKNSNWDTVNAIFHQREWESITAEFTPRVRRANHPNFTSETMEALIKNAPAQALLVRVTGQLLFDSEHFKINPLHRVTSWEIHPIFRLEYCPKSKTCSPTGDANWIDVDQ